MPAAGPVDRRHAIARLAEVAVGRAVDEFDRGIHRGEHFTRDVEAGDHARRSSRRSPRTCGRPPARRQRSSRRPGRRPQPGPRAPAVGTSTGSSRSGIGGVRLDGDSDLLGRERDVGSRHVVALEHVARNRGPERLVRRRQGDPGAHRNTKTEIFRRSFLAQARRHLRRLVHRIVVRRRAGRSGNLDVSGRGPCRPMDRPVLPPRPDLLGHERQIRRKEPQQHRERRRRRGRLPMPRRHRRALAVA